MSTKVEFKRLPLNVLPVNYAVTLKPNFNDFTFDGNIVIDLEVSGCVRVQSDENKFFNYLRSKNRLKASY